jgi:NADP-dependent 3-hydroxy acid dehydrogenase YdfG
MRPLDGKVAWVTGAGSCIGAPSAARLGLLGASMAVVDRAFDAGGNRVHA